jgi:hypothetical protein
MEMVSLLHSLQFPMPDNDRKALEHQLEQYIRFLINNDFSRLVQLLYTVDVDEQKLKGVLLLQPERNAAAVITELILTRQAEKKQSRAQFKMAETDGDEERW